MLNRILIRNFAYVVLSLSIGTIVCAAPILPKQQFQALYDRINGALSQGDLRVAATLMGKADQLKVTGTNVSQAQLDAYLEKQKESFKKYSTMTYTGVVESVILKKNVAVITVLESSNGTVIDPKTNIKQIIRTRMTIQNTWVEAAGQWKLLRGNV